MSGMWCPLEPCDLCGTRERYVNKACVKCTAVRNRKYLKPRVSWKEIILMHKERLKDNHGWKALIVESELAAGGGYGIK